MLVTRLIVGFSLFVFSGGFSIRRFSDQAIQDPASNGFITVPDVSKAPSENPSTTGIQSPHDQGSIPSGSTAVISKRISHFGHQPPVDAERCKTSNYPYLVTCYDVIYADALINKEPENNFLKEPGLESIRQNCALVDAIGFDWSMYGMCCPIQHDGKFGFPCDSVSLLVESQLKPDSMHFGG